MEQKNKHSLAIINLTLIDLMRGLNIIFIYGAFVYFGNSYGLMRTTLRSGHLCKSMSILTGVLPFVGATTTTLLAFDRLRAVLNPLGIATQARKLKQRIAVIMLSWAVAAILSSCMKYFGNPENDLCQYYDASQTAGLTSVAISVIFYGICNPLCLIASSVFFIVFYAGSFGVTQRKEKSWERKPMTQSLFTCACSFS